VTTQRRERQTGRPLTVLIVEDDSAVRLATAMGLAIRNINVLEARDADEALRMCESLPDPIDVAIVDVVMPHKWGHIAGPQLHALRPEMLIIYVSGHSREYLIGKGVLAGDEAFVPKPFKASELITVMDDLLLHFRPSPLPHGGAPSEP
jgi:DNA-binding NtrC family response regulator